MNVAKTVAKAIGVMALMAIVLVLVLAGYNQIALRAEADQIVPAGQMVSVNGYQVHVYTEGDAGSAPTLVFLSGSGTVAPVYDFKVLYSRLSSAYRIAVVEKAGYGYSDIADVDRDVASMVAEVRAALLSAGVQGPYVLVAHSMAGLEALYWAQSYPQEVGAIVGLDMAVPESYDDFDFGRVEFSETLGRVSTLLGIVRIPGVYPLNEQGLTPEEAGQQRLLAYRNAVNPVVVAETGAVQANARTVRDGGSVTCPIVMFCSNGSEIGESWILAQERFCARHDIPLIHLDCGHYLHYYASDQIADVLRGQVV